MRFLLLICLTLLISGHTRAQNTLTVSDVRQNWIVRQGTIDEATLTVRPKGLYMECGLYLTFSANGVTFNNNGDSLEIVLNFKLPVGSTVHDSWLWVGADILKAKIFDRWTASTIYETIVNRRSDPSILFKNSADQYQLRVFPMDNAATRRVKITWLQPVTFLQNKALLSLPYNLLKSSRTPVNLNVLVWPEDRFKNPAMALREDVVFEAFSDTLLGDHFGATLTPAMYVDDVRLQLDSPLKDGYYLSTYDDGEERFYQMAVQPSMFLPVEEQRKLAVLFDYESGANAPSIAQLLTNAETALLNSLAPTDYFNLFFAGFNISQVSDHWMPAHPDSIRAVFDALNDPLASYSNLQPLLSAGIDWVQEHDGGEILLVSNSTQHANLPAANAFLNDVLEALDPPVAIHVLDYNEKNTAYFFANGVIFYANSYLFSNLATQTNGYYVKTYQTQTLNRAFEASFSNLGTHVEAFELYPSTEDGFCYGRYTVSPGGALTNLHLPFLQIGKFVGEPPFNLEINGVFNDLPWSASLEVDASDILPADTLIREMWHGRFVEVLESQPATNPVINNIILNSLAERVLSRYTAFLCLELPQYICEDCLDETQSTATDEPAAPDSTLLAYPNPFAERTTIVLNLPENENSRVTFEIYNLKAQLVRRFEPGIVRGQTRLDWDGNDLSGAEVPAGIYLGMLKQGNSSRVLKLVKIKN